MPITFDCPECGKACRAPAEMAGRKAKCQDCKAIITVPDEEEKVAEKPLPKRKAVPAVADDEDDEKPRAKKSRKDEDDEDDEDDKPRKKKSRKDDDEAEESPRAKKNRKDDDDEEEDDSPAAKKKRKYHDVDDSPRKKAKAKGKKSGSGMGMILMLGGGALALLVLCGGGFGILAWSLGWIGGASEMAFAPDDCTQVQVMHVSQMENSRAYKVFTKKDQQVANEQQWNPGNFDAIKQAGVDSVFMATSSEGAVNVIKTKKAVTDADLIKGKSYKDVKAGKYTMHEGTLEAVCLADSTTVVYSKKPALLKKVLERGKAPELSAGMKKALGYTNQSKSISNANTKSSAGGGGDRIVMPFAGDMGQGVECSGGFLNFGSDVHFEETRSFKDAQSAEAAKKKTEDEMKKLVDTLDTAMKMLGKGNSDNPTKEMLQAIHMTVSGSEVRTEATWSADLIERAEKAQNDLKGGIGGGPGPGGKPR